MTDTVKPALTERPVGDRVMGVIAAARRELGDVPLLVSWAADVRRAVILEERINPRPIEPTPRTWMAPITFECRRELPPGTVYVEQDLTRGTSGEVPAARDPDDNPPPPEPSGEGPS